MVKASSAHRVSCFNRWSVVASSTTPLHAGSRPGFEAFRSPVDLQLSADERELIVVFQTAGSVAVIDLETGLVTQELPCGDEPYALAVNAGRTRFAVTSRRSGELHWFDLTSGKLHPRGQLSLPSEPHGVAITSDGHLAYVALRNEGSIAIVDLKAATMTATVSVGIWPTHLALTNDGERLAVAVHGECGIAVVDTLAKKRLFLEDFQGINFGHMEISGDNQFVYFPWMVYRRNPISQSNIRQGWVLASRIARVDLREHKRREAISLDPQGAAVADPHGIAMTADGKRMVVTASGTQELLVYLVEGLPFQDYGGPGDHIEAGLLADTDRFFRIPLGGRPMGVRLTADGKRAYVANYLLDSIQEVDLEKRTIARTILLSTAEPTLARRGEALFFNGKRSMDQWYSCHSCHYEAGSNAVTIDTKNDDTSFTYKSVPDLRHVTKTGPWMWHGWQEDIRDAIARSLTETMEGPAPTEEETEALLAYLDSLGKTSWNRPSDLAAMARRGEKLFRGKGRCVECHRGAYLTDGAVHDVGTGKPTDAYDGFNTPSLRGVRAKSLYLHDGRESDLGELIQGSHSPARLGTGPELTEDEVEDLVAYLRTL